MERISFQQAFYIKLGRNGMWEESSIAESKLRIGWSQQNLSDINSGNWQKIKEELSEESANKGAVTRDLNAIRLICESTPEDVWITFSRSRMWWCRPGSSMIGEDEISKYRQAKGQWSDRDINGNRLLISWLPGDLSKTRGFRGTACRVEEIDTLQRILNDEPSPEFREIEKSRESLVCGVEKGLRKLHWKDFETFVDLLFRASGWRRLSMLGETMKFVDLELEDPITGDRYQVQIKSSATWQDFQRYSDEFDGQGFRKLYFVVHSPDKQLMAAESQRHGVELVLPTRLSQMTVDLGLVGWLMHRIK